MKWTACLVALAACQAEAQQPAATPDPGAAAADSTIIQLPKAALTDAYKADIAALCDALQRSGADDKPAGERWIAVAMWLGPNIKTEDGHAFLVAIQPLRGEAKALALETEARRAGLATCALAAEWRASTP